MPTLMGIREYARHRGVSHVAVIRAVKDGRITKVLSEGKEYIDAEVADIQWENKTDTEQSLRARLQGGTGQPDIKTNEYENAKIAQLRSQVEFGEIKKAEMLGLLVAVAEVERELGVRLKTTADRLMNMAYSIAPILAAENDQRNIIRIIREEVRVCLRELTQERGEEESDVILSGNEGSSLEQNSAS
jgi:hypothetical protein